MSSSGVTHACYNNEAHQFQVVKETHQSLGSGYIRLTSTVERLVCLRCGCVVEPFGEEVSPK